VDWVYFSPHFDDAALSCGGLVWQQAQSGQPVSIWTVCAGKPRDGELSPYAEGLHARWQVDQDATIHRKSEDLNSCELLGAGSRYFSIPDCIYRRHPQTGEFLYASETALNGPLHPGDTPLITKLQTDIKQLLKDNQVLVCPLGLGNHVDHQLTRSAVEGLDYPLWYYEDYPYVLRSDAQIEKLKSEGLESHTFTVSKQGLVAWQDSIAAHASQISTFWASENEMRQAIIEHWLVHQGIRLWKKPRHDGVSWF
jgi:LmbE family N-acetylglucosaminyl deacetylase